jgi:hypothetical protein
MKPKKVHCYGAIKHFRRPVCGAKLGLDDCVSRMEFRHVKKELRCRACASTKWARFL